MEMNNSRRRDFIRMGAGVASAAVWGVAPAFAQGQYPTGPIKIVLNVPVGGGMDSMMRLVGQKLTESWGQPVVIDARPGANGAIAAAAVARSPADGLTLLATNSGVLASTVLQASPGYRMSDLAPVSIMALAPVAIGVRAELGITTLQQYVQLAKSKPGKLSFGSYGPGSGGHFIGELLNVSAGIQTMHIPYKGEAPAIQDLLGGQIDAVLTSLGTQMRQGGRIVPLATTGSVRFPAFPAVPTFTEAGFPEANLPGWNGLFVPSATPRPVIDKLSAEIIRILKLPDVANRMVDFGFDPVALSQARSAEVLTEQLGSIQRMVREGRVKD